MSLLWRKTVEMAEGGFNDVENDAIFVLKPKFLSHFLVFFFFIS